jgi:hypothetical protein
MGKRMFENSSTLGHPRVSVHVFLLSGGRVLLVRRSAESAYAPNLWHARTGGRAGSLTALR